MSTKTVSHDIFNILINYAKSHNIDTDSLLKSMQFNQELLEDRSARIPVIHYQRLWQHVVSESNDENFGLHFGLGTNDFCRGNVLCSVMMNCSTIHEAIQKFIKYYRILSDLIIPVLRTDGDTAIFSWKNNIPEINLDRHQSHSYLFMLYSVIHCLSRGNVKLSEVRFSHSAPDDISELKKYFNTALNFDYKKDEILFQKKDLNNPVFLANPDLLNAHVKIAEELLNKISENKIWSDKIRSILSDKLLKSKDHNIEIIADELAMSIRNLQNKLKAEGESYLKLINQVRKEIALSYINDNDCSLYDVAFLLGFSEQSSFNHAFKRWTGYNPNQYIEQMNMQ